jgi:hypothetical protein
MNRATESRSSCHRNCTIEEEEIYIVSVREAVGALVAIRRQIGYEKIY